jgi:hypothetical protein
MCRTNPLTMRILITLSLIGSFYGACAQDPSWNVSFQFRNPGWVDDRLLDQNTSTPYTTPAFEQVHSSIAFGGTAERQLKNGCAIRFGFEHARNAMDRNQIEPTPAYYGRDTQRDVEFRQEINTLSLGVTHYLSFGRLEPFFGGEVVMRKVDVLKENIHYSENDLQTGVLIYSSTERVRYSGGTHYGFAPLLGFRYRVVCGLHAMAEFAPTWTWGSYGQTRTSVSTQEFPDELNYTTSAIGGTSGGPFFVPRFGVGLQYVFKCKSKAPEMPATAPAMQ